MIHHNSTLFRTAASLLKPILLVAAMVLLFRGHNAPGGGFIGGLVAAAAYSLNALAHGALHTRTALRTDPERLIGCGILLAALSGLPALLAGEPFLKGYWYWIPGLGNFPVSTILVFDLGVFLVVVGMVTLVMLTLLGEMEEK